MTITDEDQFANTFSDLAAATRVAYPGLFKRAFKLHQEGIEAFGLTNTLLTDIVEKGSLSDYPKLMLPIIEPLLNYTERLMRIPKGVERAKAARKIMESALSEKRLIQKKSSCKKNCSACCHMKPYATESEIDLILEYVDEKAIEIDVERLKRQQAASNNFEHLKKLSWEDSACVFLSPEGACKIYPVRPLNCMKHFILSDPKECDVRVSTYQTSQAVIQKAEVVASALLNVEFPEGKNWSESLPELLLKKIEG